MWKGNADETKKQDDKNSQLRQTCLKPAHEPLPLHPIHPINFILERESMNVKKGLKAKKDPQETLGIEKAII